MEYDQGDKNTPVRTDYESVNSVSNGAKSKKMRSALQKLTLVTSTPKNYSFQNLKYLFHCNINTPSTSGLAQWGEQVMICSRI